MAQISPTFLTRRQERFNSVQQSLSPTGQRTSCDPVGALPENTAEDGQARRDSWNAHRQTMALHHVFCDVVKDSGVTVNPLGSILLSE
jgi:hypothetical protein